MSERQLPSFRDAVSELEEIQAAMGRASRSSDSDWRRELINLRRSLQAQIRMVALALDNWQLAGANERNCRDLKEALSNMRYYLARHQADWPAVSIDLSNPAYVQSTAALRAANRAFIDLAGRALDGRSEPSKQTTGSKE